MWLPSEVTAPCAGANSDGKLDLTKQVLYTQRKMSPRLEQKLQVCIHLKYQVPLSPEHHTTIVL